MRSEVKKEKRTFLQELMSPRWTNLVLSPGYSSRDIISIDVLGKMVNSIVQVFETPHPGPIEPPPSNKTDDVLSNRKVTLWNVDIFSKSSIFRGYWVFYCWLGKILYPFFRPVKWLIVYVYRYLSLIV